MQDNNSFNYTYKAPTEEERRQIESIRRQYRNEPKELSSAERLKYLHSKVMNTATCYALVFGVVGILIFGLGLTCILEWSQVLIGVIVSAIGAIPAALAYPIYNIVLSKGKAKYGEEIIKLSDELLGDNQIQD